ncbi:MAG TPA: NAD-dependent epimerase/dehydratase family protein [Thermoanaerobaculia bacterium]|nr:NAD-dependent epimerase/dehydratase family protein [Thermoanaerobaculia bacterium]
MRSVVTGAGGFLGSHLVDSLLKKGHEVIGIDNFITGDRRNLKHLEGERRFKLLDQDVRDLAELPGSIDFIFHLASPASPIDYDRYPIETLLAGSEGTHRWLEVACETGARFLLASTSEVYGDPDAEHHPQSEDYAGNVNPVGPRSCYDEAKRFAEALTTAYRTKHRIQTRIIRIFNTYGSRMRSADGRVIPMFLSQALDELPLTIFGDGSQTRSFCYVDDLIAGILAVMASDFADPVNLGNPDEITMLDLAREIIALTGSRSKIVNDPPKPDEPRQRRPNIDRARTLIGWEPEIGRAEGLRRTLKDFQLRRQSASTQPVS